MDLSVVNVTASESSSFTNRLWLTSISRVMCASPSVLISLTLPSLLEPDLLSLTSALQSSTRLATFRGSVGVEEAAVGSSNRGFERSVAGFAELSPRRLFLSRAAAS